MVVVARGSGSLVDHHEHTVSAVEVLLAPVPKRQTRPTRRNRPGARSTSRETVDPGTLSHRHPQKVPGRFAGAVGRDCPGGAAAGPGSVAEAAHRLGIVPAVDRRKQILLKVKVGKYSIVDKKAF